MAAEAPPPPPPVAVLRSHNAAVTCLCVLHRAAAETRPHAGDAAAGADRPRSLDAADAAGAGKAVAEETLAPSATESEMYIISGDAHGVLLCWLMATRRVVGRLVVPTMPLSEGTVGGVLTAAVVGATRLAVHMRDGRFIVYPIDAMLAATDEAAATAAGEKPLALILSFGKSFCRAAVLECPPCGAASFDLKVALAGRDGDSVDVWSLVDGVEPSKACELAAGTGDVKTGMCMACAVFHSESSKLGFLVAVLHENGVLYVLEPDTGATRVSVAVSSQAGICMAHLGSLDQPIVTGSAEKELCLVEIDMAELHGLVAGRIEAPKAGVGAVAIREDKRILVSGGWDGRVRVFDVRKRRPLAVLDSHKEGVNDVVFCNDARGTFVTAGQEGRITVWELYPPKYRHRKKRA